MKSNKGISLIVLIIVMITIIFIGATFLVFVKKDNKKEDEKIETKNVNNSNEIYENVSSSDDKKTKNNTGIEFWVNSKKWPDEMDTNGLSLYNDKLLLPIKLENLDSCSAPYSFWTNYGFNQINADTIQEILESTEEVTSGEEIKIATQQKVVDGKFKDYDEVPDHIEYIRIKNYGEKKSTIAECYKNGWWRITSEHNLDNVLGIELVEEPKFMDNSELINKAVDRYGAPTYIGSYKNVDLNKDTGSILYDLVYEKDDYVITFSLEEFVDSEAEEPSHNMLIVLVSYYSKDCWEAELNKESDNYKLTKIK